MADFEEGRQGRLSRNISTEDMSTTSGRRGKPEIEIYRPGSGKLRRSAGGHGDFEGPKDLGRFEDKQRSTTNSSLKYNQNNTPRKNDVNRVTDDFDRLSVSSNSSRNRDRHVIGAETPNSSNSDSRKRSKKPEVARYVPKPLAEAYAEQDNRLNNESERSKTPRNNFRNDIPGRRERSRKQSIDEVSNISETPDINRSLNDLSTKSERPRRSKVSTRRRRSEKPRGGRSENTDENIRMNGIDDVKPTPLMAIKFTSNTLEALKTACNNDSTGYETTDGESESRDSVKQYVRPKTNNIYDDDRIIRQASEPRSLPPSYSDNRIRDTRSVEPCDSNWGYDKIHSKPPTGIFSRRGKVIKHYSHPSFDSLPPRLQKKYIEENGLQDSLVMHTTYIGTNSEELWDGSSVTFQGSNANLYYSNVPPPSSFTQPPPSMVYSQMPPPPPPLWSQTLPPSGSRGRGRLRPEDMNTEVPRYARSLTPDTNSTSVYSKNSSEQYEENMKDRKVINEQYTGRKRERDREIKTIGERESNGRLEENRRIQKNDNQRNGNKEGQQRRDVHRRGSESDSRPAKNQDDTKPLTPDKLSPDGSCILKLSTQNIVDWAEEVERNEKQKSLHQSSPEADLPRATSLNSLQDSSRQSHYREKRRRRKRSLSRDRAGRSEGRRRGSIDNSSHRSRNNSSDRRYNRNRGDNREPYDLNRNWRDRGSESRNSSVERWNSNRDNREYYNESRQRNNSGDRYRRNDSEDRSIGERYRRNISNDRSVNDREPYRRNHSNDRSSFKGSNNDLHYRSLSKERRGSRTHSGDRNKNRSEENWRSEASKTAPATSSTNVSQRQEVPAKESQKPAGILVLPLSASPNPLTSPHKETENLNHNSVNRICVIQQQRKLFDPSNPNKPIMVSAQSGRISSYPMFVPHGSGQPVYGPHGELLNQGRFPNHHDMHNPHLWIDIERADFELQRILSMGKIFDCWPTVTELRRQVEKALCILLSSDIKICEQENIEQYVWKILYYSIIEYLRKGMNEFPDNKDQYRQLIINIIEEGTAFFEQCIQLLEEHYKFKLEDYLHPNCNSPKGKGYLTLALISTQKMLLFLGDLSRYKEQANDSTTYGFARQWYMKAHQLNPKNGRPYNQLAILAIYARRKLDAVYYYMRSLMASVPVASARESLLSLFDENRRKYEQTEKKRREEREAKEKERMKEKENGSRSNNRLRREIWIHPDGGRRVHRTTSTAQHSDNSNHQSEEDELAAMSELEVNKRFGMSFLHVHGKLFTKIGMETFQEAALQMLREFRALLQHSPLPLNPNRLLQLLALNMFSIENTQLKNSQVESNYRSALQESALVVSLQMFNLILERCIQLLKQDEADRQKAENNVKTTINTDIHYLLPAIKIWCDWLLCHPSVWIPPPSCRDYRVGTPGDIWSRLATLVNLLEKLVSQYKHVISTTQQKDYVLVRLSEDTTLGGFNPLMPISQELYYANKDENMEVAEMCLRIQRILFFGTVYLCGIDPPVLKLHKSESGESEYISVVETPSLPEQSDNEVCVESFSSEGEGEGEESGKATGADEDSEKHTITAPEIQSLLHRKEQLEQSHRRQEQRRKQVQTILQQSTVSVEMEVRPHFLVPDTNCYIDYLPQLQMISRAVSSTQQHLYTLMVPLVVLNELDGLTRGHRDPGARPAHVVMVTEAARAALDFLRSRPTTHPTPAIRCVTTRGTILNSATFTSEQDSDEDMKNDDRILATCLNLCRTTTKEQIVEGEPRHIYREVVLLTEDRNLRVKALARDMPVREVPDFMKWAGLGNGSG